MALLPLNGDDINIFLVLFGRQYVSITHCIYLFGLNCNAGGHLDLMREDSTAGHARASQQGFYGRHNFY